MRNDNHLHKEALFRELTKEKLYATLSALAAILLVIGLECMR